MKSLNVEARPIRPSSRLTDVFMGFPVTDPYRWLEDQDSPRTRGLD